MVLNEINDLDPLPSPLAGEVISVKLLIFNVSIRRFLQIT